MGEKIWLISPPTLLSSPWCDVNLTTVGVPLSTVQLSWQDSEEDRWQNFTYFQNIIFCVTNILQWVVRVLQPGSLPTGQSGVTVTPPGPSLVVFVINWGILKFYKLQHQQPAARQHDQTTGGPQVDQVRLRDNREDGCDGTWLMLITLPYSYLLYYY